MAVRLYLDVHVPRSIVQGLRLRGVNVLTAQEDESTRIGDEDLVDRATELNRVIVTSDHDFLAIADARQADGRCFSGVIFVHPLRVPIGVAVRDLELIARAGEPSDLADRVEFLPLRPPG